MALVTRSRVSSLTSGLIVRTSETVDFDTPASRAMSMIVTARAPLLAPATLASRDLLERSISAARPFGKVLLSLHGARWYPARFATRYLERSKIRRREAW